MRIDQELRQLYLNHLAGFRVLEVTAVEGYYEGLGVYLITIEGPSSIPPHNTLIRLYEW